MLIRVRFHGPTNFRPARWSTHANHAPRRWHDSDSDANYREDAERAALDYATETLRYDIPRVVAHGYYDQDDYVFITESPIDPSPLHTAAAQAVGRHPTWPDEELAGFVDRTTSDTTTKAERLAALRTAREHRACALP